MIVSGCGRRDFLDVHAARGGCDDDDALGSTIHHEAEIDFAVDVRRFLDVEARNELAGRTRLMRHELAAEHELGRILDFLFVLADLDAAGLAAGARVDLRFHDDGAAEFAGAIGRLLRAVGEAAARDRHAELREKLLGLVLMNVHVLDSLGLFLYVSGLFYLLAARAASAALMAAAVTSRFFAIFSDAASIILPSSEAAPLPWASASFSATRMRSARSTSLAVGE